MPSIKISHFTITQAAAISAFVTVLGWAAAFVPSIGVDKQNIIAIGSTVIAGVFMLVNALHTNASAKIHAAAVQAPTVVAPTALPAPVASPPAA